ncbi:MAG: hypothetical protein COA99_02090 [Moraxellaceae bacterium]|nr:MAG: hypothetical protein COA99_02090 [Moraxellaceae bacterium]
MKSQKLFCSIGGLFVCVMSLQACSRYDPVPASDCNKVVSHAQKVLGSMAPSRSEMMTDCKKASDNDRGCIMAATKKGQIAQCG